MHRRKRSSGPALALSIRASWVVLQKQDSISGPDTQNCLERSILPRSSGLVAWMKGARNAVISLELHLRTACMQGGNSRPPFAKIESGLRRSSARDVWLEPTHLPT